MKEDYYLYMYITIVILLFDIVLFKTLFYKLFIKLICQNLPGGMIMSIKAIAKGANALSQEIILTCWRFSHVLYDGPPDLAVIPLAPHAHPT